MILYKYCPVNTPYFEKNLLNSTIYQADPYEFNDPFEIYPVLDYSTNIKDIRLYLTWLIMKKENLSKAIARRKAVMWIGQYKLGSRKKVDEMVKNMLKEFRKTIGVSCYTTKPDNLLMWAHYACNHTGACMQFYFPDNKTGIVNPPRNKPDMPPTFPLKVNYSSQRPIMTFLKKANSIEDDENTYRSLTTKSVEWKYENEYRICTMGYVGEVNYDPSYLKSIILGSQMNKEEEDKIRKNVKKLYGNIAIYRANLHDTEYKLEIPGLIE